MSAGQVCLSKDDIDKPRDIAWAYTSYITTYVRNGRAIVITILLASFMEGVALSLLASSTMTIIKSRTKRTITYFPLVALFFMFASVVLFWTGSITSALHDQDGTNTSLAELHDYLSCSVPTLSGSASTCAKALGENWKDSSLAPFLVTMGLVIAMVIGNAVVWWRVFSVYPHSKAVKAVGIVSVLLTLAAGLGDLQQLITGGPPGFKASMGGFDIYKAGFEFDWQTASGSEGQIFENAIFGLIAAILSFATNAIAACFAAYKTWKHRKESSEYLPVEHSSKRTLRTGMVLSILAECGILYCAIWIAVIGFLISQSTQMDIIYNTLPAGEFIMALSIAHQACLLPIIVIYSTIIILVVALGKSPLETMMSRGVHDLSH